MAARRLVRVRDERTGRDIDLKICVDECPHPVCAQVRLHLSTLDGNRHQPVADVMTGARRPEPPPMRAPARLSVVQVGNSSVPLNGRRPFPDVLAHRKRPAPRTTMDAAYDTTELTVWRPRAATRQHTYQGRPYAQQFDNEEEFRRRVRDAFARGFNGARKRGIV